MMHNTLQINATQMAPERRGAAVAAFAACFFLGQSFGVAIGGALLSVFNTGQLLVIAGGGVWLTSLAIGRRLRQRATEQH
jgi:predicted MFS family arabinose efflux permease